MLLGGDSLHKSYTNPTPIQHACEIRHGIATGETVLIALNGTSQFYLKHTTPDQIFLYDGNGVAVHSAQWTHTLEGVSLINHTETHAGAGPSGTNAPSSSTTWSEIDWLNSAWSTPGEENPVWPAYAGSEDITVTEIATACELPTFQPAADWIEFYNQEHRTST